MAVTTTETGYITGTADKDYNIIWFTEACLSNALRLEVSIQDAERSHDHEHRSSWTPASRVRSLVAERLRVSGRTPRYRAATGRRGPEPTRCGSRLTTRPTSAGNGASGARYLQTSDLEG